MGLDHSGDLFASYNGEDIDSKEMIESESIDPSVRLMDKPFNPSEINIENKLLNIDLLIKRMAQKNSEIELNTSTYFQRKSDLWNVEQQSRLIESILIRFPLPAFYFDGSNKNKWLVVDGLQRLSSIRNFAVQKTLRLTNLEFLTQLDGCNYDDLDRDLQRIIEETQVVAYIINPGTPADVKFNIFKRINTGGLVLEPQEIRHALNQGEPAEFIAKLANTNEFKEATSFLIKTERMLDRDLVNRFLGFYLFGHEGYTPDLDTFMNKAMAHINKMNEEEKQQCFSDFVNSMKLNLQVFGRYAFRKIEKENDRRNPLNKALFDSFSVAFAKLSDRDRDLLLEKREKVMKMLIELITQDDKFLAAISSTTGDKTRVTNRFVKVGELVKRVLKS